MYLANSKGIVFTNLSIKYLKYIDEKYIYFKYIIKK